MCKVPVVGMLSAFLREVRTGALGPYEVGRVCNVVSGFRYPFGTDVPVEIANELRMAVGAAVVYIN